MKVLNFSVEPANVNFLESPRAFYETLLNLIRKSKEKIVLMALYLGDGDLEKKLVTTLDEQLAKENDLQVELWFDGLRGMRKPASVTGVSTFDLIRPLAIKYPSRCSLFMYTSKQMQGIRGKMVPSRFKEVFGVSHMKIYMFDDDLMISGANLGGSYFDNRQDRYLWLKNSPAIVKFHQTMLAKLKPLYQMYDTYKDELERPARIAQDEISREIQTFWASQIIENGGISVSALCNPSEKGTFVVPSIQMGSLGVKMEEKIILEMLQLIGKGNHLALASGYLNLTNDYWKSICQTEASCEIISASPEAHGFQGSRGMSRYVPTAYSYIMQKYLKEMKMRNLESRISFLEYSRQNWTFHCKGLWLENVETKNIFLTSVGSSNFGARSVFRDLESQLFLYTSNPDLQKRMKNEFLAIKEFSKPVAYSTICSRKVPLLLKGISPAIKSFL